MQLFIFIGEQIYNIMLCLKKKHNIIYVLLWYSVVTGIAGYR